MSVKGTKTGFKKFIREECDFTIIWDYRGSSFEVLKGNEEEDSKIRSRHFFSSGTPNIELALSILNLSKHKKVILFKKGNILDLPKLFRYL